MKNKDGYYYIYNYKLYYQPVYGEDADEYEVYESDEESVEREYWDYLTKEKELVEKLNNQEMCMDKFFLHDCKGECSDCFWWIRENLKRPDSYILRRRKQETERIRRESITALDKQIESWKKGMERYLTND